MCDNSTNYYGPATVIGNEPPIILPLTNGGTEALDGLVTLPLNNLSSSLDNLIRISDNKVYLNTGSYVVVVTLALQNSSPNLHDITLLFNTPLLGATLSGTPSPLLISMQASSNFIASFGYRLEVTCDNTAVSISLRGSAETAQVLSVNNYVLSFYSLHQINTQSRSRKQTTSNKQAIAGCHPDRPCVKLGCIVDSQIYDYVGQPLRLTGVDTTIPVRDPDGNTIINIPIAAGNNIVTVAYDINNTTSTTDYYALTSVVAAPTSKVQVSGTVSPFIDVILQGSTETVTLVYSVTSVDGGAINVKISQGNSSGVPPPSDHILDLITATVTVSQVQSS